MSTRPRRTGGSSSQARVAAVPPKRSSQRVPVLRLTKLEDRARSNLSSVSTANKGVPAQVCLEGLDFVGHCPICLRKLLDTANDSDDEDQDSGRDEDSVGIPITPRNIPPKSASRVWQYLHSSFPKNSTTTTPRFTFRMDMEEVGQDCRGKSRANKKNRRNAACSEVANLPTMCRICYVEILKLRKLHEELLVIEMTLKSQVDTLKKIVEGSTSRRKKFEETISTSYGNNGEWMKKSKPFQFLQYIRAELNPSVPESEKRMADGTTSPIPTQAKFEGDYLEDDFEMLATVKEESDSSSSSDSDFDMSYNDGLSMSGDEDASSGWGDQAGKYTELSTARNELNINADFENEKPNRHTRGKSWVCQICSKTFPTRSKLESHTTSEHKAPTLRCHICSKEFQHGDHLNAHVRSHNKEDKPPPTCDVCGYTFRHRSSFLTHMSTHTGERPYCCEHCGKRFRLPDFLRQHKNFAHRDIYGVKKTFSCELCGKVCYKRSKLEEHKLIHSDIMPWVCEVCGKGFRVKSSMKSHWNNMHSKPRPRCDAKIEKPCQVVCIICDMTFTTKRNLADHNKRLHTDWTPYSCEECSVGFKTKWLLRDHKNMVHITKVNTSAELPESAEGESAATQEDDDTPEISEPVMRVEVEETSGDQQQQ